MVSTFSDFYLVCFASKPLRYVDSERTRNQVLLFTEGVLKGAMNCLFKKLITLRNGKRNLQNTLSIAHLIRAFSFLFTFALVCEVF